MDPRVFQAVNLIAVLATIAFNAWASALPLNGVTQAEVSASYPSLFTPAGWAFSIWGVIYAALLVFSIYQLRPGQRGRLYLRRIGWLHGFAAVCNVAWLVVFHYAYGRPGLAPLTLIPMGGLFAALLTIYLRLRVGSAPAESSEKLAVQVPFSIYLGWVTVATMANFAFVLNSAIPHIPLAVQRGFTVLMLLVVLAVGLLILRNRHDVAFALVLVWAAAGVAARHAAYPEIAVTGAATALVIAAAIPMIPRLSRGKASQPSDG